MRVYILRRLLLIFPTLLGITVLSFVIIQLVPGGPVEQAIQRAYFGDDLPVNENRLTESELAVLKEFYGFDKPVMTRYWIWLKKLARFDFGLSYRYTMPVSSLIIDKLPVSCYYGLITALLLYAICIPLGILKAIRHRSIIDTASSVVIFLGYSIPPFAFGFLLLIVVAGCWDLVPLGGFVSDDFESLSIFDKILDLVKHSILPLAAYMVGAFAWMTMLIKNSLLENLSADFVRTAFAKGAAPARAVFGHAFRNSLIPLATSIGHNLTLFLMGSFLIETIFNIDGMGLLGYSAVVNRDYPVVMALLVIGSLLALLGNLLSDCCVAIVDPRIRFE